MPDRNDLARIFEIEARVVEQHIADTAAENDAERRPDEKIVDRLARDDLGRLGGYPQAIAPAQYQPDNIGQGIPADGDRADREQHRIDGGVGDGEHQR